MAAYREKHRENWAGNVRFTARSSHSPVSVPQLQELVASNDQVRALGAGHSFNRIADTPGSLITVDKLPRVLEIDPGGTTVRAGAGLRFGDLCAWLQRQGLALQNLGSLPHISLAGACATGTHGSGNSHATLASAVRSIELVTADGTLTTVSRGSPEFGGAAISLGALGIVTNLSLDLCPTFDVEQYVYAGLPWRSLIDHFVDIVASAYSVSIFTNWHDTSRLWVKRRADDIFHDLTWTGARAADRPRHPVEGMSPANCTQQMGVAGPWNERLPHFRSELAPSTGAELQSEYFIPRANVTEALQSIKQLHSWITPVLHVSEIRTVASDTCWLSPSHQRHSVTIHFTWIPDAQAVAPVLDRVEEALSPYDARPHWGKLFGTGPERLSASYGRWSDFCRLLRQFDPMGKFRNELLDHYFPR